MPIGPTRAAIDTLAARGVTAELVEVPELTHFQTPAFAAPMKQAVAWLRRVWDDRENSR